MARAGVGNGAIAAPEEERSGTPCFRAERYCRPAGWSGLSDQACTQASVLQSWAHIALS